MELAQTARRDHWITRYAKGITILGILIILGGVIYGGLIVYYMFIENPGGTDWATKSMILASDVRVCVAGFLVIALSEMLVFTIGSRQKPGWILRRANWGLFLMAGLSGVGMVLSIVSSQLQLRTVNPELAEAISWFHILYSTGSILLATISTMLIFITLGLVLRRVLPVIEESKAVV